MRFWLAVFLQLLPENPIDMVVRAINTNGGRANTNDITTRQSFQESRTEDGSPAMTPLDEAKTESEVKKWNNSDGPDLTVTHVYKGTVLMQSH